MNGNNPEFAKKVAAEAIKLSGGSLRYHESVNALRLFGHRWIRVLSMEEKWKVAKKLVGNDSANAAAMIRLLDALGEGVVYDTNWNDD